MSLSLKFWKLSNIRYYKDSEATDFLVFKTLAESRLLSGIVSVTNPIAVIMDKTSQYPNRARRSLLSWTLISHLSLVLSPVHDPKAELGKSISPQKQNKAGLPQRKRLFLLFPISAVSPFYNFTRFSCFQLHLFLFSLLACFGSWLATSVCWRDQPLAVTTLEQIWSKCFTIFMPLNQPLTVTTLDWASHILCQLPFNCRRQIRLKSFVIMVALKSF